MMRDDFCSCRVAKGALEDPRMNNTSFLYKRDKIELYYFHSFYSNIKLKKILEMKEEMK